MVKLYHTTRNQKGKNIYNYSHYVKIGLQQIDQDSRTHHETKTRLLEEIFSPKSGTQSRDSIPGSRDWHFSIPKFRDWKRGPGLQSLHRNRIHQSRNKDYKATKRLRRFYNLWSEATCLEAYDNAYLLTF